MNVFNIHDLTLDNPLTMTFQKYINDYPQDCISEREECNAYIEEYYNDNGQLCARLREKETNKHIVFWTSPNDKNAIDQKKGLLQFLSEAKTSGFSGLYKSDGDSHILIQGYFGKETNDTIEIISYMAELFYVSQN